MRKELEHASLGGFFGNESPDYDIAFRRAEALPPDAVSLGLGISAGSHLAHQRCAEQLYGYGETGRPFRILDLGTGIGTFLIGVMASNNNLPTELTGLDRDESALNYAAYNIRRVISKRSYSGQDNYSAKLLNSDWHDPEVWQSLGKFDVIFLNPPYLAEGQAVLAGYENVPKSHLFTNDVWREYKAMLPVSMRHLNVGGRLIYRLPGASSNTVGFQPPADAYPEHFELPEGAAAFTMISSRSNFFNRTSNTSDFSLLADGQTLPPWADPRVLVYMEQGYDIQNT